MKFMTHILIGGAGLAASVSPGPATAQDYIRSNAAAQCAAAVDDRLGEGRVLAVTDTDRNFDFIRVHGVASSGFGPYGVGAYGALGYGDVADLEFSCDVDYRGFIRDVDIDRRD